MAEDSPPLDFMDRCLHEMLNELDQDKLPTSEDYERQMFMTLWCQHRLPFKKCGKCSPPVFYTAGSSNAI
jgi:hypothetical protein